MFPPLPTVMQGVLRSHHLAVRNVDVSDIAQVSKEVGETGKLPDGWVFRGPSVARRDANGNIERFYPLPLDAQLIGDEYRAAEPPKWQDAITDLQDKYPGLFLIDSPQGKLEKESGADLWVSDHDLNCYLEKGCLSKGRVNTSQCFFEAESRLGIERDNRTRSTRTGMLYETEFVRLHRNVGLYVEADGIGGWPNRGVLGIGGESRAGIYHNQTTLSHEGISTRIGNRFKVVFLSPTYLDRGWTASDWSKLLGTTSAEFKGAAVGKPIVAGGFDLANKQHKPSYRFVPAGSVYFFELKGEGADDVILKSHALSHTPKQKDGQFPRFSDDFFARIGFGQYAIGGW
jgi:CRISPR-associated protein Cmr3